MSKYYDKTAASFKSVTIDTKVLDAQKILVKPSTGDSTERVNILDLINEAGQSVDTTELEERISALEDLVEGYKSVEFKSNTTGNSNETEGIAMQFSKAHFIPGNSQLQQVSLPFTQAAKTLTDQYCHIAYYNDAEEVIATHISNTTQSRTQGQTGKSTWTFPESCIVPESYKYVRVCLSGVDYAVNFGVTSKYRINVVNNDGVDFDDDECCVWTSTSNSPNYLGDIEVMYGVYETILDTITSIQSDLNSRIDEITENQDIDYVVETSVSNNTWYRIYKSGWVEQGGITAAGSSGTTERTVTLPVELDTSNYFVQLTQTGYYNSTYAYQVKDLTATSFKIYTHSGGVQQTAAMWEVKGLRKITTPYDISIANGYIPDASSWNRLVFIPNNLIITRVENESGYNGNIKSINIHTSLIEDGSYLMEDNTNLTSWNSDLSSLTDGSNMFNGCTSLTQFSGALSNLVDGYNMFFNCKLNTASIQNIADTIKDVTGLTADGIFIDGVTKQIDIGIENSTPNEQEKTAFRTMASRGWTVYVIGSSGSLTQYNPADITSIDGEETITPIPYYGKPVASDEEHAEYIDADGNYFNIVGGQFIYGDDLSTYGMFTCEEDAAFNMGLTKIDK